MNTPVNLARTRASELVLEPFDNVRLANLCGQFDEHLRQMEQRLGIEINNRGNVFRILGTPEATRSATTIIEKLYESTSQGVLTPSVVHLHLQAASLDGGSDDDSADDLAVRTRRILVRPRGSNQRSYLQAIRGHDISFGVGPAGTGKTYLAVACAVEALESEQVRRLVLVRPAVEAGERLGFLPGDMTQKIDPYLRPLYDALYEMLGFERVGKLIERGVIEVAPLAFMRGRTLNEAFIILDEGQNTTVDQMKMFLTRIGFGSTAVVTGDITQVDLPRDKPSGLRQVVDVLNGTEGISFTFFRSKDVVRHPVVARILDAYDSFDNGDRQ